MRAVVGGDTVSCAQTHTGQRYIRLHWSAQFPSRGHTRAALWGSSLITPRCTPLTPRPCPGHWRYGLWGFWKTCSSYTTGFQFSYFEIYNFVLLLISLFQTMNISKRQCIRLTAHRWRSEPNKGVADCAMELRPWRPGFLYLLKCWRLIRECFLTSWSVAIQEKDTFRLQPTWSVHYEIFI